MPEQPIVAALDRLGLEPDLAPTLGNLRRLQRAQLDRVPYENLEIMLGRPPSVDPAASVERMARTGRAGYCFHQNGAAEVLLRSLGYDVQRRHGHVWTAPADRDGTSLNHLVLVVSGLPSDDNPGGRWWPDVGLGEGFLEPLPLIAGSYPDGPLSFGLEDVRDDGWTFGNDPSGSFAALEVRDLPVGADHVEAAHRILSTPPDGAFTRVLVVQRRDPDAQTTLRGCVLTRIDATGVHQRDLTTYDEWRGALDELRLPVSDLEPAELHALWKRMLVAHRAWDEAGRP